MASHAHRYGGLALPRPGRAALPLVALALAALVLEADPSLRLAGAAARRGLARELDQTLRSLDAARLPSASPLRRGAARRHEERLRRLEERMLDGRPVTARGVLLLQRLLREPTSPLYDDVSERELSHAISTIAMELES